MRKVELFLITLLLCIVGVSAAMCEESAQPASTSNQSSQASQPAPSTQITVSVVVNTTGQGVPVTVAAVPAALPVVSAPSTVPAPAAVVALKPSEPGKPYTSVIIDATGVGLDRCMSPKIRKSDGSEVWGTMSVDIDFVEDHGIVGYAKDMGEALKCPRSGANPLVIKAIGRAGGNFKSDPIISNADAAFLLAENAKGGFLEKFNVIFIKDGKL